MATSPRRSPRQSALSSSLITAPSAPAADPAPASVPSSVDSPAAAPAAPAAPTAPAAPAVAPSAPAPPQRKAAESTAQRRARRMEIYAVSEEQAGRFRTAAHFASLEGFKSFSEWAVHLIERDTQRLEQEHRGGQPFPPTQPVRGASQRKS